MLHNLASSSTDPALFSFYFIRSIQRQIAIALSPVGPSYFPAPLEHHCGKSRRISRSSASPIGEKSRRTRVRTSASPPSSSDSHHKKKRRKSASHRKMISMLSSAASHYWLAPHQLKSPAQLASLEEESGIRKARVPQTREIYLHPSQIFSPPPECDPAQSYPPYFPSFGPNNDMAFGHPISLPPILTFDEIEAESLRSSPMAMEEMPPSQFKKVTGRATNEHADTKIIVQNYDPSSVAHQHVNRQPSWSGLHENPVCYSH